MIQICRVNGKVNELCIVSVSCKGYYVVGMQKRNFIVDIFYIVVSGKMRMVNDFYD